jgi:hypothetical protein
VTRAVSQGVYMHWKLSRPSPWGGGEDRVTRNRKRILKGKKRKERVNINTHTYIYTYICVCVYIHYIPTYIGTY